MNRLDVLEQVVMCRRCELYTVGHGPLPFAGPSDAAFAVLGEAPNREEDDKGHHFLGAAGAHLERALIASGLELDRAFILNAASCFPDGPPSVGQVASCRTNMHDQLSISGTGPVLLVGTTALRSFRSDLSLAKAHGHVFCQQGRVFFPTFHPALRNKLPQIEADLERFVRVVRSGGGWASHILDQCVSCEVAEDDMEAEHLDDEGLLYCQDCWPRSPGGQAAKRAQKARVDPASPFQRHSPTSRASAVEIDPTTATLREQVFTYLAAHGPMTDEGVQEALGMNANTERPRRVELVEAGRVCEVDQTGVTRAGRSAVRWGVVGTMQMVPPPIVPPTEAQAVAMVQEAFPGAQLVDA